jgi:hypothetical protein
MFTGFASIAIKKSFLFLGLLNQKWSNQISRWREYIDTETPKN